MKLNFKFLVIIIGFISLGIGAQENVQNIKSLKCFGALYDPAKDAKNYTYSDYKWELSLGGNNQLVLIESNSKKELEHITISNISKRLSLSDNKSYLYTFIFSDNNKKALLLIPHVANANKEGKFHAVAYIGLTAYKFDMCALQE